MTTSEETARNSRNNFNNFTTLFIPKYIIALDRIPMSTAIESFDRHALRAQNDKLIDIPDMTTVLHSLYVTIDKIDLTLMLDLAINWILNVYDSQRTGQIRVLSFKVRALNGTYFIYFML